MSSVVDTLYEARRSGREPDDVLNAEYDYRTALQVQTDVLKRFVASGEPLGGWKVGMTSGASRDKMGKDFRPFGYVLRSRIFGSNDQAPAASILRCQIEPELCLILKSPLRGRVTRDQAKAAVRGVAPAFEINEFRVSPTKSPQLLLADGLAQWGIVVGPESVVRDELRDMKVSLLRDGEIVEEVIAGETMDDPFLSLARLSALLDEYGYAIEAGQPIITGAFCKAAVTAGLYRAKFSGIGEVEFRFT